MIPIAGSTYSYAYAAFGVFLAWFIGWDLLLEYLFAASTVAVGWAGYFVSFLDGFGIHVPHDLANPPFGDDAGLINIPAAGVVAATTALLVVGTRQSANANNAIVVLKIARAACSSWSSARSTSTPPTGTRSSRPTRAASATSAPAASCARPASCSSPSSASTPSRPPPARRATHSARCRSGCSARSRSRPCSTSASGWC